MCNTHSASYSDKKGEAKVEHLAQLLSIVVNQMAPPKLNDPTVPISSYFVSKPNPEAESHEFCSKGRWQSEYNSCRRGKSKIELLENRIKQMKETERNLKKAEKEMRDQMLTYLTSYRFISSASSANIRSKMPQRTGMKHFSKYDDHNAQRSAIQVRSGMI